MKIRTLSITIFSTALIAAAALHAQNTNWQCNNGKSSSMDLKAAGCKIHGAAHDIKDYTFEEKDAFTAKMKDELSEANKSLDHLDAKLDHVATATKDEARPKLNALRIKTDQLGKKIDAIQNATASTWESVKADSKNSYKELKGKIRRENQWLSDKISS